MPDDFTSLILIDNELKEVIQSFQFLIETKKSTRLHLIDRIQELKKDNINLINDKKQLEEQVSKDPLTQVFNR